MNKLIKYLVNGYWEYTPRIIANAINVGVGNIKDEDIVEYPLSYTYNKNTDSNKLFFFVGEINNICKCFCATLGNKPLERVKKYNSKGKSFKQILLDCPNIKKLYVITNVNKYRIANKFYGYVSNRDFSAYACLYGLYGVGTNEHRSKDNRVNFEESVANHLDHYYRQELRKRLIAYKDKKISSYDVNSELARVLRGCADYLEGKHKDFKKHDKSTWYNTVTRELFCDLFNHYRDSLSGKDKVRLMEELKKYY